EAESVIRICRFVEGMPLCIELAAVWVRILTCTEIMHELEQNLDLLSASLHDLPSRHHSLRAVFEHSWQHLTPQEQASFRRLSVFHGGFQREAAQQIASAHITDLLALADKSLLRRDAAGRYHMHELLLHYGREKLREA